MMLFLHWSHYADDIIFAISFCFLIIFWLFLILILFSFFSLMIFWWFSFFWYWFSPFIFAISFIAAHLSMFSYFLISSPFRLRFSPWCFSPRCIRHSFRCFLSCSFVYFLRQMISRCPLSLISDFALSFFFFLMPCRFSLIADMIRWCWCLSDYFRRHAAVLFRWSAFLLITLIFRLLCFYFDIISFRALFIFVD